MAAHTHERSGWAGWLSFAAIMMMVLGAFHAIEGLTAILNDEYFLVTQSGLVVEADYTVWGWVHLGLGALVVLGGVSLWSGRTFGQVAGVVVATLSAIVNLGFLAAYPVWSAVMIAIDVLVIYAILVHGREVTA